MTRFSQRLAVLVSALAVASASLTALTTTSASAAPGPGSTTIGPGVQVLTPVSGGYAQCTANFMFRSTTYTYDTVWYRTASGAWATKSVAVPHPHTYAGIAAHCVGAANNSETDTNGCKAGSLPLGTRVYFYQGVKGASSIAGLVSLGNGSSGTRIGSGVLRYSSWLAMKSRHTTDAATCNYNDFALIEVDAANLKQVNPTVPWFGGPTTIAGLPGVNMPIYTVGNSSVRGTERATKGVVQAYSVWSDVVRTDSTGVPGDSGSGYMNSAGAAVGVLSTQNCSGVLVLVSCKQNGIGSLAQEVAFARQDPAFANLWIIPGTTQFNAAGAGQSTDTTLAGWLLGLL